MKRTLSLVSKTSNEIFMLHYPQTVLRFCDYDFAYFAEKAIALCNEGLKNGELDFDSAVELRNSIRDAHVYIDCHIRTIYDKIVQDCWIDYVCRRDGVGTGTLWNRFVGCSTPFEKLIFARLCDYRYNKAINEWLNLIRVQDYAKNKIAFLFSKNLKSADEASARRNYFDLIFSVTARELGCRIEDLAVTKVFSVGRIPSAPFMFPTISKDIVGNVLADFDYSEDYSSSESYGELSDQMAMDAFAHMKSNLAQEFDSYNISRSRIESSPNKVYMPCGLKAVVDLEIDALIESGGWLARCKRCGRYYLRDSEYTSEYCSLYSPGSKTCLEIYEAEHPRETITPELEKLYREVTDMMYSRVDVSMSLTEYEKWKVYLDAMKQKVENGEIPPEDLASFIRYSQSLDLSKSKPVMEVPKKEPETRRERVVKPFVPERISRSELPKPKPAEEADPETLIAKREGFFTSPIVQRQKNERAAVTHIIRAGEQRGGASSVPPNAFRPFAPQSEGAYSAPDFGQQPDARAPRSYAEPQRAEAAFPDFGQQQSDARTSRSYAEPQRAEAAFPDFGQQPDARTPRSHTEQKHGEAAFPDFGQQPDARTPRSYAEPQRAEAAFPDFGQQPDARAPRSHTEQKHGEAAFPDFAKREEDSGDDKFDLFGSVSYEQDSVMESGSGAFDEFSADTPDDIPEEPPAVKRTPPQLSAPKSRVIRKNAAAISAYGKIAGTSLTAAQPELERISRPEPTESPLPDPDPFKNVSDIFDEIQQTGQPGDTVGKRAGFSEAEDLPTEKRSISPAAAEAAGQDPADIPSVPQKTKRRSPKTKREPVPEWEEQPSETAYPQKVTAQNAPAGIWTEDRNLFDDEDYDGSGEQTELSMLKEKKRSKPNRTSKTQRLYDAIMREPEDNPNFRRK